MPLVNPDGLPNLIPGDLDYVESNGKNLSDVGQSITDTGSAVSRTFWRLQGVYIAPEAYDLMCTINPAYNECARVGNAIKDAGDALQGYVREVRPLHERLERVKREAYTFLEVIETEVTADGEDWDDHEGIVQDNNRMGDEMDRLVLAIVDCQVKWANKIESIYGGAGWDPKTYERNWQPGMPMRRGPRVLNNSDEPVYPPWGGHEDWDKPWIMDVGDFAVDTVDALTVLFGVQWAAREWFGVESMFGHPPADMYQTFDAWEETVMDFVALVHAIPIVGDAMDLVTPDEFGEHLDDRFDAQLEDIREDWDSGNQARAVAGVLGFVPGVGRLAAIASKAGKVAGLASKVPALRKVADAADAYLDFKTDLRASAITGAGKLPIVGDVLKGVSHIPIVGESVRIERGVPLGRKPAIDVPDTRVTDPGHAVDPGRVAEPGRPVDPTVRDPATGGGDGTHVDPTDPTGRQHDPVTADRSRRQPDQVGPDGKPVVVHPTESRDGRHDQPERAQDRAHDRGPGGGDTGQPSRGRTPDDRTPDQVPVVPGRVEPTSSVGTRAGDTHSPVGRDTRVGDGSGTPGRGTEPGSTRQQRDPEHDPNRAEDQQKRRDDDSGTSTGARRRDPDSRPAEPGRSGRPEVDPVGSRRHDPDSQAPTPDPVGRAGRQTEPAPFVPTAAVGTDTSHAARASQAGSPSGDRRHTGDPSDDTRRRSGEPSGDTRRHRSSEPVGDRRPGSGDPVGDRTPWRVTGDLWDTPTRTDPGRAPSPSAGRSAPIERNVGDGVPDSAVRFIGERVQRFYETPGAKIELLDRGSERYRQFADQAGRIGAGGGSERTRKGREYLAEALDGSHQHVVVASVGDRIASAISLDIRHGELQLAKLGSAHDGVRGAASAVEHFVARYAADNGGLAVTSEMPLTDAHDFHHKLGRRTDRFGGAGLSEWSPSDAGQIARQTESVFDRKTLDAIRRDFEQLHQSRAETGIDPGASAGALSRALDRFHRDGGRVEIVENDTKADANVDLEPGAGVTVPANGRTFVSYDGRGRPAAVLTVRDTPDHVEVRDLSVGPATPGAVEAGVRELVRHVSRSGLPVRGNLPDGARAALDRSLRIDRDGRSPLDLPANAVTDIAHHLPEGERPPVHVVEEGGAVRRDPSARQPQSQEPHAPDAGTPDAGTPDAGTPDTGTPDTGLSDISRRLLGEDDDGGFEFSNDPRGSSAGAPGGDTDPGRGTGGGPAGIEDAAKWRSGDEKLIESIRSDRQRVGAPGESRADVRPVLWADADPDGRRLARLTDASAGDRVDTVDDWSGVLDGGPDGIQSHTACGERFRAFADMMGGGEPRLAPGNAFGTGESRAEMWEWLGGRPANWRHDPGRASSRDFTDEMYDLVGRSLRGTPPGTVVYLGVDWTEGGGHAFGAFVDRAGRVRWWDAQQRFFDPQAPVTGPWPPRHQSIRGMEIAMRQPGGRWQTPGPDGRWGGLGRLLDDAEMIDARYDRPRSPGRQTGTPIGDGGAENVEQHGRNEVRRSDTPDDGSPMLRVTARESAGTDPRSRHVRWQSVDRLVPRDASINEAAWKRLGDEWDRWIETGHEVRAEIAPAPPGTGPGQLRVRYSVVDPRAGTTVWDGGRGIFDHSGGALLRHPDGRLERFEPSGPVPYVHRSNGGREDFGRVFPELAEVNPDRPGLPPRKRWQNCEASVIAAELTLRGQPSSALMTDPTELDGNQRWRMANRVGLPYTTFREVGDYDEIVREIARAGDGARGLVIGSRMFLGIRMSGHVFMVVNRGDRVYFVDPQQDGWARLERFRGGLEFLRTSNGRNEGQHGAD